MDSLKGFVRKGGSSFSSSSAMDVVRILGVVGGGRQKSSSNMDLGLTESESKRNRVEGEPAGGGARPLLAERGEAVVSSSNANLFNFWGIY